MKLHALKISETDVGLDLGLTEAMFNPDVSDGTLPDSSGRKQRILTMGGLASNGEGY
jgi:hypothetical protein